jgi:hypothetical protein
VDHSSKQKANWVWWCTPVILALRKLRQGAIWQDTILRNKIRNQHQYVPMKEIPGFICDITLLLFLCFFPPFPEMVVNLQKQFSTLVDSTPIVEKKGPSSFQFNWTEEDTDRTCFHGHSLQGVLIKKKKGQSLITKNSLYWLSTQKFCKR